MCLIDLCEEMQRQAVLMELERIRPELPCSMCTTDSPCVWHRVMFQQGNDRDE